MEVIVSIPIRFKKLFSELFESKKLAREKTLSSVGEYPSISLVKTKYKIEIFFKHKKEALIKHILVTGINACGFDFVEKPNMLEEIIINNVIKIYFMISHKTYTIGRMFPLDILSEIAAFMPEEISCSDRYLVDSVR